jgi:hypothetical protein
VLPLLFVAEQNSANGAVYTSMGRNGDPGERSLFLLAGGVKPHGWLKSLKG